MPDSDISLDQLKFFASAQLQFKRAQQLEDCIAKVEQARDMAVEMKSAKDLRAVVKGTQAIVGEHHPAAQRAKSALDRLLAEQDQVRTALYRIWDASGRLLYVGISLSVIKRLMDHRTTSEWFEHLDTLRVTWYETRSSALQAETAAIKSECPIYNIKDKD